MSLFYPWPSNNGEALSKNITDRTFPHPKMLIDLFAPPKTPILRRAQKKESLHSELGKLVREVMMGDVRKGPNKG